MAQRERRGEGSVKQRADGRWNWSFGHEGERYQGTEPSEKAARNALRSVKARLGVGKRVAKDNPTLGQFMELWLEESVRGKKAPKTSRFYEQMTRLYILPALGSVRLKQLDAPKIQRFLNELARKKRTGQRPGKGEKSSGEELKPLSPSTIGHVRAVLRASLGRALKWQIVTENAAALVDLPAARTSAEPVYLTEKESAALTKASADHYLGSLIVLALNTGLRLGEATGLTWEDVKEGELVVRRQLQRVDGAFQLRDLKTRSSRRSLPLTGDARKALRDQRANQLLWSGAESDSFNPMNLVFTGMAGRPLDPKTVDKHLKSLAKKAGIQKAISFHKLRHTAGTHLVAAGVPLNVVKEILGHSQIAITANLYAHAVPAAHRAAFDVLEQAYRGEAD
jgi:integrase